MDLDLDLLNEVDPRGPLRFRNNLDGVSSSDRSDPLVDGRVPAVGAPADPMLRELGFRVDIVL